MSCFEKHLSHFSEKSIKQTKKKESYVGVILSYPCVQNDFGVQVYAGKSPLSLFLCLYSSHIYLKVHSDTIFKGNWENSHSGDKVVPIRFRHNPNMNLQLWHDDKKQTPCFYFKWDKTANHHILWYINPCPQECSSYEASLTKVKIFLCLWLVWNGHWSCWNRCTITRCPKSCFPCLVNQFPTTNCSLCISAFVIWQWSTETVLHLSSYWQHCYSVLSCQEWSFRFCHAQQIYDSQNH